MPTGPVHGQCRAVGQSWPAGQQHVSWQAAVRGTGYLVTGSTARQTGPLYEQALNGERGPGCHV